MRLPLTDQLVLSALVPTLEDHGPFPVSKDDAARMKSSPGNSTPSTELILGAPCPIGVAPNVIQVN